MCMCVCVQVGGVEEDGVEGDDVEEMDKGQIL